MDVTSHGETKQDVGSSPVPTTFSAFHKFARSTQAPIYIFGADIAGKAAACLLNDHGISVTGFLDNNQNKCLGTLQGVAVLHSRLLSEIRQDSIVLIASTYIADIINQLEVHGLYHWAPVSFLFDHFQNANLREILSGELHKNHSGGKFTEDFVEFTIANMVNSQKKYLDPNLLFIRSVDVVLTEKCSLKCRDCANLMQYYSEPVNIGKSELFEDLADLLSLADEINEIRIIGGEPLVNKDFHEVCLKAASSDKINKVVVYTNGTICPPDSKLKLLKNKKIFVFITSYGSLSRHSERLQTKLVELGIQNNIQPAYGWTDCASIAVHSRLESENRELFKNCCAKHFTSMTDGKLFRCPFSANVERLQAIPQADSDYFSIRGARNRPDEIFQIKKDLNWFLRSKAVLNACDSCNGRTYGDAEITPGIQTKKPLEYLRFERVL